MTACIYFLCTQIGSESMEGVRGLIYFILGDYSVVQNYG